MTVCTSVHKQPRRSWSSLPTRLRLRWLRAAQGPKFKIPLPGSYVPRPVEYISHVSSTPAQRSRSFMALKMLTPHGRTDGRTFDWFYKSSWERWRINQHRAVLIIFFHSVHWTDVVWKGGGRQFYGLWRCVVAVVASLSRCLTYVLLSQAKQQIRVDNDEDRLVSQVALQYTRLMVLNLTNNINKFKYVVGVKLAHKFVHHKYLLPKTFDSYFTINNTVHSLNTRINENLHLTSISKNFGKRRVQYKASKIWNQLPTSLKWFYNIKKFNTKSKKNLTVSRHRQYRYNVKSPIFNTA